MIVARALLVSTLVKQGANRVPRDNHCNCRASFAEGSEESLYIIKTRIYERNIS